MGRPSRFDKDFRVHAVELVRVSGRPRCQIAGDLGISDTTLSKWMNEHEINERREVPLTVSERVEFEQLRREKREWILEREILKKSAAFWVKECQG